MARSNEASETSRSALASPTMYSMPSGARASLSRAFSTMPAEMSQARILLVPLAAKVRAT